MTCALSTHSTKISPFYVRTYVVASSILQYNYHIYIYVKHKKQSTTGRITTYVRRVTNNNPILWTDGPKRLPPNTNSHTRSHDHERGVGGAYIRTRSRRAGEKKRTHITLEKMVAFTF
jgi:hypothetical protein